MKNLNKFILFLAAIAMISCGEQKEDREQIQLGDEPTEVTRENAATTTQEQDEEQAQDGVVEVSITGNDQMRFNKDEIRVKAGQTVRLTLEHVGNMDVNVMGHNVVILEQGTEISEFGQAAATAKDNDYIPQEYEDQIIAHTEMIGGGQTTTIEFEAPEAGTYDFICSFPGHYALMQGKFIVE